MDQSIGLQLQAIRKSRNRSREWLATKGDCSYGMIAKIEHGQVVPSVRLLMRLAAALDCEVGDFFAQTAGVR
jgi:transcriptional regulator with XRE-family HTH domain